MNVLEFIDTVVEAVENTELTIVQAINYIKEMNGYGVSR
ncbi:hypothetical protein HMPREF1092_00888 [Clostridium thermobutyricum]|uniref:Uncharacterized protein n=1 Tax=Clostridium thermobutyricum TaxID=29372 RepID=N9Y0K0_9CLOT|nr:hypothetical protein HMPREF1092_00888 [Clostridium thermobutyricum]